MESKGSFFILLVIVAILTLTLAVLAGYIFLVNGTSGNKAETTTQAAATKVPSDSELSSIKLFSESQYFNLKADQGSKPPIIMVKITLKYYKKVKGIKNVDEKIAAYESAVIEYIGTYFQNMTYEDAQNVETKETTKKELTEKLNELMSASEKEKKDIVYDVIFEQWFCQE